MIIRCRLSRETIKVHAKGFPERKKAVRYWLI